MYQTQEELKALEKMNRAACIKDYFESATPITSVVVYDGAGIPHEYHFTKTTICRTGRTGARPFLRYELHLAGSPPELCAQ